MYTKNIINLASLVNSFTENKVSIFSTYNIIGYLMYTTLLWDIPRSCPHIHLYFTCDLALTDGAGGERIDEISVCGAPGLRIIVTGNIII